MHSPCMQLDVRRFKQRLQQAEQVAPEEAVAVAHNGAAGGELGSKHGEARREVGGARGVALHEARQRHAGADELSLQE